MVDAAHTAYHSPQMLCFRHLTRMLPSSKKVRCYPYFVVRGFRTGVYIYLNLYTQLSRSKCLHCCKLVHSVVTVPQVQFEIFKPFRPLLEPSHHHETLTPLLYMGCLAEDVSLHLLQLTLRHFAIPCICLCALRMQLFLLLCDLARLFLLGSPDPSATAITSRKFKHACSCKTM